MGKLKPIGSEKLQGMDKIRRIMEIARYNENIPKPINEDSSVEYTKNLVDGNQYNIVKEKNGYVIKKYITESSEYDYIEPQRNRKFYPSYAQALKRLNIITKEVNQLTGYKKNISLFNESEEPEYEKYILKSLDEQDAPPPAPAPAPAPTDAAPAPAPTDAAPAPAPTDAEMEPPTDAEMEPPTDEEPAGEEKPDEVVTFKTIQKLTGKLAQKIRTLASDEEQPMSSKDIKYVINSILSALDLNSLEDEDKEQIISKFEGEEDIEGEEGIGPEGEPSPEEVATEPPAEPEGGEMAEMDFGFEDDEEEVGSPDKREKMMDYIFSEGDDFEKPKGKFNHPSLSTDESKKVGEMIENIFSESTVDSVLKKYFKLDEREKKFLKEKKENITKIKTLSENIVQEVSARKFLEKNPNSKVVGKSRTNNLVIEMNNKKFGISPKGHII